MNTEQCLVQDGEKNKEEDKISIFLCSKLLLGTQIVISNQPNLN